MIKRVNVERIFNGFYEDLTELHERKHPDFPPLDRCKLAVIVEVDDFYKNFFDVSIYGLYFYAISHSHDFSQQFYMPSYPFMDSREYWDVVADVRRQVGKLKREGIKIVLDHYTERQLAEPEVENISQEEAFQMS